MSYGAVEIGTSVLLDSVNDFDKWSILTGTLATDMEDCAITAPPVAAIGD
jgi:hypothetical protein